MNITEAGKQTSLTPNTLRYYERIGLIPPVARNKGGTREYTSKDLCWIEFIKTMRSAGLSPETLIEYVALSQLGDTTLEARKDILELQREVLQEKLEFIQQTLARIDIRPRYFRKTLRIRLVSRNLMVLNRMPSSLILPFTDLIPFSPFLNP